MKSILLFLAAFLICHLSIAQLPDFFVYVTHGNVTIDQLGHKSSKAHAKQLIYETDVIVLPDKNSEIELVDKDDNFIILNTKGSYEAGKLKQNISKKTEGLARKYLELVWHSMYHSSSDFDVYNNESIAASYGGGARGGACNISKFPPDHSFTARDTLIFKWKNSDGKMFYHLTLYDSGRNPIIELVIRDTQLVILSRSLFPGEYYWTIDQITHPCHDIEMDKFTLISKEEEDSLTGIIIKKVPLNKDEILYNLQVSELLGQKGFIDKALEYFDQSWAIFFKPG